MPRRSEQPNDRARPPRIRAQPDPRLSRSLEYGLALLQCFTPQTPSLGIADMAHAMGIGRSTTHRYAMTLVMLGYLEQDSRRKYCLAPRALDPGMAAIGAIRRAVPARAVLEDLRDWTGHTVALGVLDDQRALYVHRLRGHRRGQHAADLELGVGTAVPLYCTALGKALLASLPSPKRAELIAAIEPIRHGPNTITARRRLATEIERVRELGLALSDEELARGVRSIAAPIAAEAYCRPLAVEVTVPAEADTEPGLAQSIGPLLQRAAREIAAAARDAVEPGPG